MGQYDYKVERQRLLLEAEEWAQGVKDIHAFNTNETKMWYEKRPEDGRVIDTRYNDERIKRELCGDRPKGTKRTIWLSGNQLKGDDLINAYTKQT
jgi:hypothetical protein